jgi:hypothetical protein
MASGEASVPFAWVEMPTTLTRPRRFGELPSPATIWPSRRCCTMNGSRESMYCCAPGMSSSCSSVTGRNVVIFRTAEVRSVNTSADSG